MTAKKLLFNQTWRWEREVEEFVKKKAHGSILNIPCGQCMIGLRVDVDKTHSPDIIADMSYLPFRDNLFDTVVSDPPWKMDYYHRMKPFFELVRVCKPNGTIIFNATWLPESKYLQLIDIWIRQSYSFANVSVIAVFKKVQQTVCTEFLGES